MIVATCGLVFTVLPWFFATPDTPAPAFAVTAAEGIVKVLSAITGSETMQIGPETPVGAYLLIALACMGGGVFWTGVNIAQMGIQLGFSDGAGRSKYVASSAALISIGGVLGGLVGGTVAESLSFLQDSPIGPFQWNNWHATFALSMLARILGVVWAARMEDPGSGNVREMFRYMGMNAYNAVAPRLFYARRIIGWRRRNNNNNHNGDDRQNGK